MNYNIYALGPSLYSREFYQDVEANRVGSGFSFLAFISLIKTILICAVLAIALLAIPRAKVDDVVDQTPEVTVKNGELSINQPSPYYIKSSGKDLVAFDTENFNDKPTEEIFTKMRTNDWLALATKTKIYMRKSGSEYRVYDLSEETSKQTIKFTKYDVRHWLNLGSIIFLPLAAVMIFLFIFLYKIIQMLIYSIVGIILNSTLKKNLDYITIQRLVSYTLWPPMLVTTILGWISFPALTIVSFLTTIGYVYFAINSSVKNIVIVAE